MVSTLRAVGVTHVSLGNHEQDLRLDSLRARLEELSAPFPCLPSKKCSESSTLKSSSRSELPKKKEVVVLNSNMQQHLPPKAEWMQTVTRPHSLVESPCKRVKVALLGLISDEKGVFRDDTFKSVPIRNVLDTYTELYDELAVEKEERVADLLLPLTHESMVRDRELARHMLELHGGPGLIIGGHEHDVYQEVVTLQKEDSDNHNDNDESAGSTSQSSLGAEALDQRHGINIVKSGMDARNACLVDLTFEVPLEKQDLQEKLTRKENDDGDSCRRPRLVEVETSIVNMSEYEPSPSAQRLVDKHMSVVQSLEDEILIDANDNSIVPLPPNDGDGTAASFSSKRARFQQTTIGGIFCQMMKKQLEQCDVAVINGGSIKGDKTYGDGIMSYAQLKNELPFPTKMVVVEMKRRELYDAVHWSRTGVEDGTDPEAVDIPRRGYLQVDFDWNQRQLEGHLLGRHSSGEEGDFVEEKGEFLRVALPRNLLNGFCKIQPLVDVGKRLKKQGRFPSEDDFVPAIDLIVRFACKNRWLQLVGNKKDFDCFDLNQDGVLDRDEIKIMMTDALGYEPADFVVDDMIASIDTDENGVIDRDEVDLLLKNMTNFGRGESK